MNQMLLKADLLTKRKLPPHLGRLWHTVTTRGGTRTWRESYVPLW